MGAASGLPAEVRAIVRARTDNGVFVVGPDERVVHWDLLAERLTGLAADGVEGRPLYEAVPGNPFCSRGCSAMRLARAGRAVPGYEAELRPRSGEGKRRWLGATVLCVETGEGPYLVHMLRDVREAREALELARALVGGAQTPPPQSCREKELPNLTPRQAEVLRLLSGGKSARTIGRELNLAETTVRGHIQGLLRAFGMHSQLQVVARAQELGLKNGRADAY